MRGREIRRALRNGQLICATAVTAPSQRLPKMLSHAGIDFVFIDTEHTALGRETLSWMCHAFAGSGIPPVVRISSPDPYEATRALDGGAQGIIVPYVESAEQVSALSGSVRWRPLKGLRLEAALRNPEHLEPELRSYLEAQNEDTIFIINIESVPAIENLEKILSVPGLDGVLIGPHDLSCSLGIPEQYRDPRFDKAVRTIIRQARAHKVGCGIHFWEDVSQEIEWARAGANLIMHSSDLWLVGHHLKCELNKIHTALGDSRRPCSKADQEFI